jgi:hypothetical protein
MITFEIDNKEYELPSVLTIENYIKVYNIKDLLGEQFFQAKLINAVTNAPLGKILMSPHAEVTFITNHLMSLFPDPNYKFHDSFELNGVEYGFIPSWKQMSFAEFVDLDTLLTKSTKEIMSNLHIICAIMYRPIISKKSKHNFLIEDYDPKTMLDRAELFKKELDVKYVLGGQFFFSRFAKTSLLPTRPSLTQRMKIYLKMLKVTWKMRKMLWRALLNKHSDGSQLSTEFAMMTLQSMTKSSKDPWWRRLTNYLIFWKRRNR